MDVFLAMVLVGHLGYHIGRAGHIVPELGRLGAVYWVRQHCICWAESAGPRVKHTTAGRTLHRCLSKGIENHGLHGLALDLATILTLGCVVEGYQ